MKRIAFTILSAALALSVASCDKDFLERGPKLSLSNEIALSTYDGLDNAVLGAYSYMSNSGWYGGDRITESDMRSGNGVKSNFRNSNRCAQGYNWNYTPDSTPASIWAYCYYTATAVDNVIDNLEGKGSEQDLNNLKAECLFLRAFAHFENVILYAQPYTYKKDSPGVPYVFHTDAAGKPARETVEQVYNYVLEDLLEAESIIDPNYVRKSGVDPLATANINTIRALLSRVYLYMGNWQKAADYATLVIESGKYRMWTAEEYPDVWGAEKGSGEIIFEVYGKRSNDTYASWEDLSYLTSPEGSGDPQVSPELYGLFAEGDVRLKTFRTDKDDKSHLWWTAKYPGKGDNAAPDCNNIVIFRLSEMYLNRAEAAVNGANTGTTAVKDLNVITANRGAAAYTSAGLVDIQTERRKELCWEGHYFYDLARWGKSLVRTDENFTLGSMNQNVEFPSYKWAIPIPKREIEVNPNLVQNKGYTTE